MVKKLDLRAGEKFGHWEIIEEAPKKRNARYWHCKCSCGIEKIVSQSSLVSGNSKSCGCKKKPRRHNDLTGKKFGRLVVIEQMPVRENGRIVWKCKCDCGNYLKVKGAYLTTGETKSCGCLKKEQNEVNFREKYDDKYVDDVNVSLLTAKIRHDNKSGVKGVAWDSACNKWQAYISFAGKQISLGRFANKEDAIRKRKEAEEKYHKPYLEEKENE